MKLWITLALLMSAVVTAAPQGMARISGGTLVLPFRKDTAEIKMKVDPFNLDIHPVTLAEFRNFTRREPDYARSKIRRVFAEPAYLSEWKNDTTPPTGSVNAPVTQVSWFAAKAYCASQGKRLPTTGEWEWAAKSLPPKMDSAGLHQAILNWYSRPQSGALPPVGSGSVSGNGVRDLFGSVWEWTSDFDAFGFTGFNQRGIEDSAAFCGVGSARATKEADYATYMRWAFRLSMRPDYTVGSLGFRCASDSQEKAP